MHTIMLVEDEPAIADSVSYALKGEGYAVQWCGLGREAVAELRTRPVDLVILDVGLPDGSGFEVCKEIRAFSEVPIIFLTARNDEIDRVVGLEIGGDDYVGKPFSPRELVARVRTVLKRSTGGKPGVETGFSVDADRARITYQGVQLDLTRYEFLILQYLLSQPERIFSREQILEAVWSEPDNSYDRVVDTHIKTLRAKLRQVDAKADPIRTHRGLGYSISSHQAGAGES